jgi:hypothetical protein
MKACVTVLCFAIAAACVQPVLAAVYTQRGTSADDIQEQLGTTDADSITQKGLGGDDLMSADGGDGPDTIWQDGGGGDDEMYATGGMGNDNITQLGGPGRDRMFVNGGYGTYIPTDRQNGFEDDDVITVKSGDGNDTITYVLSPGNDRVFIDGGHDYDTLIVRGYGYDGVGKGKTKLNGMFSFTIVDRKGRVLYQNGEGGTLIRIKEIENLQVEAYDGNGEVTKLFQAGEL